jgi:zinc protease
MGNLSTSFFNPVSTEMQEHALHIVEADSQVTIGSLENGLNYYIRPHNNPENRAFFRFVLHVGSLHEDEDQRGLAHILEHMAFNGSTHFAPQALDAYFQSIGMKFGAHVNASTGFDKTIYKLEIPTDDPSILEQTFRVLQDWGSGLSLPFDQIEKERRVGLEEWRGRRSGRMRTMEQMLPTLYWGAKHVDRLPIGTEESLQTFEHDALKRFYRDWYRPELCSLVVVGDVNVAEIEQKIQEYLGGWTPLTERVNERFEVPIPTERMVDVIQDDTIPFPMLVLSQKKPTIQYRTEGGWAWNILKHELMVGAINERFRFLHRRTESQVQQASISRNPLTKQCEQESLHVALDATEWKTSIQEIVSQCKQLRQFGITQGELDRAKQRRLAMMKAYTSNLPSARSGQYLSDIMATVLDGESLWPPEKIQQLTERWIPQISLEAVNATLCHWLQGEGLLIHFLSPEVGFTKDQVLVWLDDAEDALVERYVEEVSSASLLTEPLPSGEVITERIHEELEIREWVFSNGVRIWLKQTDFDEDMIQWTGLKEGGYSLMEDESLYSTKCLSSAMKLAGAGPHTLDDLSRLMDAVPGTFRWKLSEQGVRLAGRATEEGLLPTLQHCWLQTQYSTFNQDTIEKLAKVLATSLSNDDDPETVYSKKRSAVLNQDHIRCRRMESEDIASVQLAPMRLAYERMIKTASAMDFVLIGNFEWSAIRDVLVQTLGALPPVAQPSIFNDRGIRLIEETVRHEFRVFDEPKAEVELHFVSTQECGREERYEAKIASLILQERLRKSLREQEAGTYHVYVEWKHNRHTKQVHFDVIFGCSPDRAAELETKALTIVRQFVEEGVSHEEVELEKGKMLRAYEKNIKNNEYWHARMVLSLQHGQDLMDIPDQLSSMLGLTSENMNASIRKLYSLESQCTIVGLPREAAISSE